MSGTGATGEPQTLAEATLERLKDFQRRTAEWAFHQLFLDDAASNRFLVADEVGLGKTHVAKGVLAQTLEHLAAEGDRRHDVVYICSNGAIANQNLRKLAPKGISPMQSVERLTMLPLVDLDGHGDRDDELAVNLLAITPGTSLAFGRSTGRFEERALVYAFLRELWGKDHFPTRSLWVFWHGIRSGTNEERDDRLRRKAKEYRNRILPHVAAFGEELAVIDTARTERGDPTSLELLDDIVEQLKGRHRGVEFPGHLTEAKGRLISGARRALATLGIAMLDPDLVILDEFQRFKDVIDPKATGWDAQLARRLFDHVDPRSGQPTRTLLLSATPYRMYTLADEDTSDHYEDFLSTCAFLFGDDQRAERLGHMFARLRAAFGSAAAVKEAPAICAEIQTELRTVMARTERLAATPDRGGMLVERDGVASIEVDDVRAYLRLGDLAEQVKHHEPSEYWKSSPYLFNFMERYQLKQRLDEVVESGGLPSGERLGPGPGMLDWRAVDAYQKIDPQNGRMRWLLGDLEQHGAYDLLWIPASQPYYRAGTPYEREEARTFTKRLVFSSWAVVPKVIACLVSHEAERRVVGVNGEGATRAYSAGYASRGGRRLDFRLGREREVASMNQLLVIWPSPALAALGDPLRHRSGDTTLAALLISTGERIGAALAEHLRAAPAEGPVDQRWYWAAPLLLDAVRFPRVMDDWFGQDGAEWHWAGENEDPGAAFMKHLDAAWDLVEGRGEPLGCPPGDLVEVLAEAAVGGAAVCALRAIAVTCGLEPDDPAVLASAARSAWGLRALFNSPEVTALVEQAGSVEAIPYWRQAIRHSAGGNLQAVLDEHCHVLRDWLGCSLQDEEGREAAASIIAEKLAEALGVMTASPRVDVPKVVGGELAFDRKSMRTRFAAVFGRDAQEEGGQARIEALSAAFNSPFWPFVLASTSVGQEGLDFHLWCHAVVHWNLPSNPVDLEQREGRVHRFKGHVVRRNLASAYGATVLDGGGADVWSGLFAEGAASRVRGDSEMVPYWIFNEGPARVERLVPIPPYSREEAHLPRLRRSLAAYRLAFGQPRQEELVDYLGERMSEEELAELRDLLRIDLAPPG